MPLDQIDLDLIDNGGATSGQLLTSDGTKWVPQDAPSGGGSASTSWAFPLRSGAYLTTHMMGVSGTSSVRGS